MRLPKACQWVLIVVLTTIVTVAMAPLEEAFAGAGYGFGPRNYDNGAVYGQGVYFAPNRTAVSAQPDENAQLLQDISWQQSNGTSKVYSNINNQPLKPDQTFFCFYPNLDVAMMAVVGDNGEGWVEVVYDQQTKSTGWVKLWPEVTGKPTPGELPRLEQVSAPPHFGHFYTWVDFMKHNAKAHGIYWLTGVSSYHRSIRMMDKDDSPLLETMAIRDLKVRHVRGNWMLVEVLDFARNTPIGWVRWRDSEGNLLVFPNITNTRSPIMVTGSF